MPESFDRELERVVDRLRTLPVARLAPAAQAAYETCQRLLDVVGDQHPLPRLADHSAGDQLAVIGAYVRLRLEAAPDLHEIVSGLVTELRRTLP